MERWVEVYMEAAVKGAFVLIAAGATAWMLRRASAAARHVVWMAAFASLLLLPLFVAGLPRWQQPDGAVITVLSIANPAPAVVKPNWLLWTWLAGTIFLAARLLAGHIGLLLLTRRAGKLRRNVLLTAEAPGPLAWGRFVILPASAASWPRERRRAVLLHELAHLRRGDGWWHLLTRVVTIIYWFHPLVWLAAHFAQQECERACDDLVLRKTARPTEYARHLIDIARSMAEAPQAALAMTRRSTLETRLRSILDAGISRGPAGRRLLIGAVVAAVAVVLPLAALQQKADQPEKAEKIGDGVTAPKLIYKVEPDYTEEARDAKISGSVVLKIEISKEGVVDKADVTVGLDPGLDANAVDAIRQWRFEPAQKDGSAVRVAATVQVNFKLN